MQIAAPLRRQPDLAASQTRKATEIDELERAGRVLLRRRRPARQGRGGARRPGGRLRRRRCTSEPEHAFGDYDPELVFFEERADLSGRVVEPGMQFEGPPPGATTTGMPRGRDLHRDRGLSAARRARRQPSARRHRAAPGAGRARRARGDARTRSRPAASARSASASSPRRRPARTCTDRAAASASAGSLGSRRSVAGACDADLRASCTGPLPLKRSSAR